MAKKRRNVPTRVSSAYEDAYPSSPHRPPTINLWLKFGADWERLQIHAYCARWAAAKSLEIALNGRGFKPVPKKDYPLEHDLGWYITEDDELMFRLIGDTDGLLDSLGEDEIDWEPAQPYLNDLRRAAGLETIKVENADDGSDDKPNRVKKVRPRGAAPIDRSGLVSLADICAELRMDPRDARKILRNKVEKPDAGWAWPESEVAGIRKLLK